MNQLTRGGKKVMRNDKFARYEISGQIISVTQRNKKVELILNVLNNKVQVIIPRACCNPNRLYRDDVVRITGTVADYNEDNKRYKYTVIFARGAVRRYLGGNETNDKIDFVADISLVGALQAYSADDCDDEFYEIIFRTVNPDEVQTLYMLKSDFDDFMNDEFDYRRLVHVQCRSSVIQWHDFVLDIPVSKIKNYVVNIKTI